MDAKEKLEQGYIQSRAVIEIVGKPKEHVESAMKQYIERIKNASELDILKEDTAAAKELEGKDNKGMWISFVEMEMLSKDIPALIGFCFDYMPSSIEIIEPKELKLKENELTTIMNDLQGKLHKLDMGAKQLTNENQMLQRNSYFLATNLFSTLMRGGVKKLDALSRLSGMSEKDTKGFLDKLEKQSFVKKEGEEYTWTKQ